MGYKIPQISKEFDLLRFGEKYNLNLELKRVADERKIHRQLTQNQYYLGHLDSDTKFYSFVSASKQVFRLDDNQNLERCTIDDLATVIKEQGAKVQEDVDRLFEPTKYLVSPFNQHGKFLNGEYFLTSQQENFENRICSEIDNSNTYVFISISGNAGTGKTLLSYHLVKKYLEQRKRVLIIHCAQLNEGQNQLIEKNWDIISIKALNSVKFQNYDVILIDEAQRLNEQQLTQIIDGVRHNNLACIFSHDARQRLQTHEKTSDRCAEIERVSAKNWFRLTDKIRTNKEIGNFIKSLFDRSRTANDCHSPNIQIRYFKENDNVREFLSNLENSNWKVLGLTTSLHNAEPMTDYALPCQTTSHKVIGQEFDNVALVIDSNFAYTHEGYLFYKSRTHYPPVDMLFQNLTRTRKKLMVVILNNREILNRCLSILS